VRELEKTFAALSAVLFIIVAIFVLIAFNLERRAFSSATYKQAFAEEGLYEQMPALMASTLHTYISQNPNAYPFLRELSAEDWQVTIASLLPAEELRGVADGALDSTFDYVNRRTDTIIISLLPIKAHLAGESGVTIIRQFLQTQPACTIEQLTQMGFGLLGGDIALCNPPPEAMGLVEPLIRSQMQTITAAIPNDLTLAPGATTGTPNDPRVTLHMVRSAIRFSPFFALVVFLAIAVFGIRSFRDLFVWWGWPLLIAGAVSALIGLVGSPIVGGLLQFLIETQGIVFLPPLLASGIGQTAGAVAHQMLIPVALQGLVMAVIGFFMVIVGIFLTRRERTVIYTSY
jgi:hypothetical protein